MSTERSHVPDIIDPIRLANQGAEIEGEILLNVMQRLTPLLYTPEGGLAVSLKFGKDEGGKRRIECHLEGELCLRCQRCNQALHFAFCTDSVLSPIVSESQATSLPKEYEPLVTYGEPISLVEMLEEEILLALPMVARHEKGQCPVDLPDYIRADD